MHIVLEPSRLLAAVLIAGHGLAIGAIVAAGMPPWLQLATIAAVVASLILGLRNIFGQRDIAVIRIAPSESGKIDVQSETGAWEECEVLGSSYASPLLTVLNLTSIDSRRFRRAVVLPDSMSPEDFRALRVWLRWKAAATGKT
ncbi:MAG TPA: protein YgfX [Burkholderiales bacterium]|nr:protein YgfX [Burkholderiales bacterium]